jgi:hypothetical protein
MPSPGELFTSERNKSASVRPESPDMAGRSEGSSLMRGFVFGLALIPLVGCGSLACRSVFAGDVQAPGAASDNSQQANPPSPGPKQPRKKKISSAQSDARSARPLPLSEAETYASGNSADLPVSSAAKSSSTNSNSSNTWTGFYVGAGVGAAHQ